MFIFSAIGEIFGHSVARSNGGGRLAPGKDKSPLIHRVAEVDEGFVGIPETNEPPAGIFDLKCGLDGQRDRHGEGKHVKPASAANRHAVAAEKGRASAED